MTPVPAGFAPVRYPDMRPLPSGRNMLLRDDIEYRGRLVWRTRRGLVTDGASIPALLWPFIGGPFEGRHRRAALFHDDYYKRVARERTFWSALTSRKRAVVDRMLAEIACADGAPIWRVGLIYLGVRLGGGFAWLQHARRNASRA
jgi:hypothetical protein